MDKLRLPPHTPSQLNSYNRLVYLSSYCFNLDITSVMTLFIG